MEPLPHFLVSNSYSVTNRIDARECQGGRATQGRAAIGAPIPKNSSVLRLARELSDVCLFYAAV